MNDMTLERLLRWCLEGGVPLSTPVRVIDGTEDGTWLRAIAGITRTASGVLLIVLGDALDQATDEEMAAAGDVIGAP